MYVHLALPKDAPGPFPTFLIPSARNWRELAALSVRRGHAMAYYRPTEASGCWAEYQPVVRGRMVQHGDKQKGFYDWGVHMSWVWKSRRVLDVLEERREVDTGRIIMVGISRWGHITFITAAEDPRVAMTICSQTGQRVRDRAIGCAGYPFSDAYVFSYQLFANRNQAFPVDNYMLMAAIAPRPLLLSSSRNYWAYRPAMYNWEKVAPVYTMLGFPVETEQDPGPGHDGVCGRGRLRHHIRDGGHQIRASDWTQWMDVVDECLKPDQGTKR
jgi:hypothetical protein